MSSARARLLAVVLLALPGAALVADAAAPPAPKPTPAQIARWIKDLGDEDFHVREVASRRLRAAGEGAEEALEEAVAGGDIERVSRARKILDDLRWGLYPEVPPKVRDLIATYRTGGDADKVTALTRLLDVGPAGCRAVARVASAEERPEVRRAVFFSVAHDRLLALPALLEAENFAALEALLELSRAGGARRARSDQAAYWLMRGQPAGQLARWERRVQRRAVDKEAAEMLAYLHRARGDRKAARRAAEKAGRPDLLEALLFEAADWGALARRLELVGTPDEAEQLGYRAAYARLAGDRKGLEEAVAALRKGGGDKGKGRPRGALPYARALFFNDRPAEALALLAEEGRGVAFEARLARLEVGEAFALVARARKAEAPDLAALELRQARTLYELGEKDKALAVFKR
jgi:hypothetical protein